MSASRETVMTALLALLSSAANFATVSRRNRAPENIGPAQSPALFLVEHSETYKTESPMQPPRRTLEVRAIIYNDIGADGNAIPATVVNDALDQLDKLIVPDSPMLGRCTLGGLVYSLRVDGQVVKAPGDVTGKSLAVVPLKLVLP